MNFVKIELGNKYSSFYQKILRTKFLWKNMREKFFPFFPRKVWFSFLTKKNEFSKRSKRLGQGFSIFFQSFRHCWIPFPKKSNTLLTKPGIFIFWRLFFQFLCFSWQWNNCERLGHKSVWSELRSYFVKEYPKSWKELGNNFFFLKNLPNKKMEKKKNPIFLFDWFLKKRVS